MGLLVSWKIWRVRRTLARLTRDQHRSGLIHVDGRRVRVTSIADPAGRVDYWMGYLAFRWWGRRKLQFYIYVDDSFPHPSQLQLLAELTSSSSLSREEIETSIFQYYAEFVVPAGPVDFQGTPLKIARSINELRPTIGDPTFHFYMKDGALSPDWSMSFAADWDDEHGVRLEFTGMERTYVGN